MSNIIPKLAVFFLAISLASFGIGQTPSQTNTAGGPGGSPFTDSNIQSGAQVREVQISGGRLVDSVQMIYELQNGRTVAASRHGGPGGNANTFRLDSDEYITGISGRYGQQIDSIRIHTNRRTSPVYGGTGGSRDFRIDVPAGNQAVGFIGRSGTYIDAIGLLYAPVNPILESAIYGGPGGNGFSDISAPSGARITEIRVNAGKFIDAVQAVYTTADGRTLEGPRHGGEGGRRSVFRLDADEYLIGISGRYGKNVDSIMFRTNKRNSPAFGGTGGNTDFRVDVPAGGIAVGFVGRSGTYLDAIGLTYTRMDSTLRKVLRRLPGRSNNY